MKWKKTKERKIFKFENFYILFKEKIKREYKQKKIHKTELSLQAFPSFQI